MTEKTYLSKALGLHLLKGVRNKEGIGVSEKSVTARLVNSEIGADRKKSFGFLENRGAGNLGKGS